MTEAQCGAGSPEYFERLLDESGFFAERAPEPWAIMGGQEPFQTVLIDATWVDDDGIHLALERFARVDDGEGNVVCNTEAEIASALTRFGADPTDAAHSARSLWESNREHLTSAAED